MPSVSLSEAARLAGVSRKTIQRRVQDGVLSLSQAVQGSVQGEKFVEISELIRVFGELPGKPSMDTVQGSVHGMSHPVQANVQALEARIEGLEAVVAAKDATIETLTGQVDELREEKRELRAQVAGLLEDNRRVRAPAPAPAPVAPAAAPAAPQARSKVWDAVPLGVVIAVALVVLVLILAQQH